jgi:alpha-glucosidase
MWWDDAVIYQVYPRSFQDSDGDGIGDLRGIESRLDHVESLGVAAIWLSPFYRSPNADFGYDIADYDAVDPVYGSLEGFDRLARAAHERGLRVLVDFVGAHTSTEHPWFREQPDYYFWADEPPNNWQATFGGSAWQRDPTTGRLYLHSFFPEQADLNWRNPEVRAAMAEVLRFWLDRGVDGFRLDAVDRLLKDPDLRDDPPAARPFPLPLHDEYARLDHLHSLNAPDIGSALEAIRDAVGDAYLVGEAYLPTAGLSPYLDALDTVFAFESMNAGPTASALRATLEAALEARRLGWVLSNHDFSRFATRFGLAARALTLVFMMLPGPVFMLQGDELGVPDGPGVEPPLDRAGRDRFRHPMQWDGSELGGFTTGTPWLPLVDPGTRNVADQEREPSSWLHLVKRLVALRRGLGPNIRFRESPRQALVLERDGYVVAVNLGDRPASVRREGELVLEARPGDASRSDAIPPHGGWIARA